MTLILDRKITYGLHILAAIFAGIYPILLPMFLMQILIVEVVAGIRPSPLYLTGSALASAVCSALFLSIVLQSKDPEGLWIIPFFLTWPGALALGLSGAIISKHKRLHPVSSLLLGLSLIVLGFVVNTGVVCNTAMWCGRLFRYH
ncbi:hypothetical protein [Aquitalea sp. LB_tupeE]|uniref:hypothetical protein n=1 Tax=Aquitalea sp. LB_tupeE TaxID=2748078 RepID=UPI0015BAAA29|nr:hypothetical protein [Aquitalea sp. LB_tupeE]NWK80404.1 hypothetical protein [Aquitalea sp. LB_tupeE]